MKHKGQILTIFAVFLFFVLVSRTSGQTVEQQTPLPEAQQRMALGDPIRQLNLSPEQREKIRSIRDKTKGERAAINERLRATNLALEEALDADNPDETVIDQRVREVSAAQAALMRMRVLTEVRIRRVLTPEQLVTLRTLREQTGQFAGDRFRLERQRQQQGAGQTPMQTPRNNMGPLFRQRRLQERPRP